jgi:hypothetical protein
MSDTVAIQIPRPRIKEGSAFTATAYFRAVGAASTPTNVSYRLDNLTTGERIADWTSVSAAANVSIAITGTQNAIRSQCNRIERMQLTVAADHDLSTEVRDAAVYEVENLQGVS